MSDAPRRIATVGLDGAVRRLTAELVGVKDVDAGHGVSYGSEYRTPTATTLGLVAAGYADGVPRSASGAPVTIDGVRYLIRGRVAMDQVVLDLGGARPAVGSEAVLFGDGGASVTEWAAVSGLPSAALESFIGPRTSIEIADVLASTEETERFGERLASVLAPGDAVVLTGALGAGKTTLTRGIGAGLGAHGTIQSPTFVIARTHRTHTAPLIHVDAYRLGGEGELDDLDLDLDGSITVAEWGLPLTHLVESSLHVELRRPEAGDGDDEPRSVRITGRGPRWPASRILSLVRSAA